MFIFPILWTPHWKVQLIDRQGSKGVKIMMSWIRPMCVPTSDQSKATKDLLDSWQTKLFLSEILRYDCPVPSVPIPCDDKEWKEFWCKHSNTLWPLKCNYGSRWSMINTMPVMMSTLQNPSHIPTLPCNILREPSPTGNLQITASALWRYPSFRNSRKCAASCVFCGKSVRETTSWWGDTLS